MWDISTGNEIRSFTGHDDWVTSVSFSTDGKHILSGSKDGTIKIWDANSGSEIVSLITYKNDWLTIAPDMYFDCSKK